MASSTNVRSAITCLLASLVRRFGHSISCCVKLTQLLQCFPHMVNCILAFVRSFMEEQNIPGVVRELLKVRHFRAVAQLCRHGIIYDWTRKVSFVFTHNLPPTPPVRQEICSYSSADLERDSQASTNFHSFLLEVSGAYPQLAQSILPLLRPRLDEDPYSMRNCVLGLIGEVLSMFAQREQLDAKESLQRDRLMDLLQVGAAAIPAAHEAG